MKSDRLIAIIMFLLQHEQVTAEELARRFEVSARTIYRDLETINQAGIPILSTSGPGNGVQILDTYRVEKRLFSTPEIMHMLTALDSIGSSLPHREITNALAKVQGMVSPAQKEEVALRARQLKIDLSPWLNHGAAEHRLNALRTAMDKQCLIRFLYRDNHGETSERRVEPYRLLLKSENWYLQGYCQTRRAFRTFKILRMQDIQRLEETFAPRHFPAEEAGFSRFQDKTVVPATLRVHISVLDQIAARFGEGCLTPDGSDFYTAQIKIPLDELAYRYLLGFGSRCVCLAPEELRQNVHALAAEICRLYEN